MKTKIRRRNKEMAKEGSKSNPTKIKAAQAFFVECPRCDEMIDTGQDDEKLECPECGRKFYIEFDRFDCGI